MGFRFDRMQVRALAALALMVGIGVGVASDAAAQGAATLKGTVTDNTSAVVPGASITVLNTATALQRETVTSGNGTFVVMQLPPGVYSVTAVVSGFAPYESAPIQLKAGEETALAIVVRLAPMAEQVTVRPELQTAGSTSLNADTRRTENDPQPYVVFDREELARTMSANVGDFLKTRLPMNTTQDTASQQTSGGNRSAINLRGLGTNQTLILVDGRRMPGINQGAQGLQQADINGIPSGSVERIEVLPATASGIYGGGATGGVINIITRKDYAGVDVGVTYANASRNDAGNYRLDGSAGFNLHHSRTQVFAAFSFADAQGSLKVGDRDFAARGRAMQFRNNPEAFYGLATPPSGYTSNIRSANGSNLVLDGGTPLNAPRTFIPPGYRGTTTDAGAALVANAGQYNLDIPNDFNGALQGLYNGPTVASSSLTVRQQLGARVQAFGDVSWFDNRGRGVASAGANSVTLAADAPNNPFTTPIVVSYPVAGLTYPIEVNFRTLRATGGTIVRLPKDWIASADYAWSLSRNVTYQTNPATGDPDGPGPGISDQMALTSGLLDVMRDVNAYPLDWSPYLLRSPNRQGGPADTSLSSIAARVSGPVARMAGGPLTVSALVERRKESADSFFSDSTSSTNTPASPAYFPSRWQTVTSAYVEARGLLVSSTNARPFLHALELQASTRYDNYDTRSATPLVATVPSRNGPLPDVTPVTNGVAAARYTAGVRYLPSDDVTVRASYGTGFLPPSITQVVPNPELLQNTMLTDPKRGAVAATTAYRWTSGGNPNLQPEDSTSWSAGAIFTPRVLSGLRVSIDHTRIEKRNEISSLAPQGVLDLEDAFPDRITRLPLDPADAARGYTGGAITAINSTSVNIARTHLIATDVQADYTWRRAGLGQVHGYAVATWQPHFERQTLPTTAFLDYAGFNNPQLQLLKRRGNAGITWQGGPWSIAWSTQYYDSYIPYAPTANATTIATTILNQGAGRIASQTYHDLFVRYRLGEARAARQAPFRETEISFGMQNLFDTRPPVLATTAPTGGYSLYADPRLRLLTLTVRTRF
jgi:iron complex outermembrane recepter protein